jgi:hypothetical protein
LSELYHFSVRSSGRDLTAVRRPKKLILKKVIEPDHISALKKPELVALAEEQGLDTSGTRAELIERLVDE